MSAVWNWISIFFFQAEDGIRDHCVTGVQTWLFRSAPGHRPPRPQGRPAADGGDVVAAAGGAAMTPAPAGGDAPEIVILGAGGHGAELCSYLADLADRKSVV